MKRFAGLVVGALIFMTLSGGGFPAFLSSTSGSGDALGFIDDGEVVGRFESQPDKKGQVATITVLYDRIEWERTGEESQFYPKEATVFLSDIKKLNSWGTNFLIRTHDGMSLEFQLLNGRTAGKLKRKIKELMKEQEE